MSEETQAAVDIVRLETATALSTVEPGQLSGVAELLAARDRRWFCSGQGRSGLVARMIAMRMMHAGYDVHAIGESTTPAVQSADALLVLSASGQTPGTLHVARGGRDLGADVVVLTGRADSPIAACASRLVLVDVAASRQFGGSLFEQAALLLMDAVLLGATGTDQRVHAAMQRRHANLE